MLLHTKDEHLAMVVRVDALFHKTAPLVLVRRLPLSGPLEQNCFIAVMDVISS